MALPVVPIALAAGAFALARNVSIAPVDQRVEDRFDDINEGFSINRGTTRDQINTAYKYRRIIRFGKVGPAIEIDASGLARLRIRRVRD